eukprot:TRINITY_DN102686_c0_g1_i1.p1 TRINITY_DN102686_c0_g1~~TRINITY_DN102686_c0_g1_i1.p1  ORF type:complete len:335 (+),score=61.78 TRINITY_DN102686_c0_g1_i1:108-1112(+)
MARLSLWKPRVLTNRCALYLAPQSLTLRSLSGLVPVPSVKDRAAQAGASALAQGEERRSFGSATSSHDKDPYKILGIDRGATEDEIKKAYRKEAMKWHPDRQPPEKRAEAQTRFSEVAGAYEILSDPEKRKQFDTFGGGSGNHFQGGRADSSPGPGWQHSPESAERLFREVFGSGAFEQMLGQIFGNAGSAQLRVGAEAAVLQDAAVVLAACRRSGIDSTNDAKRRQSLGRKGRVVKVDPKDNSVKVNVDGVGEVWFGADAVRPLGAQGFPGGLGGFGFSHPRSSFGGGAHGGVQEIRQEMVTTPDGRRVLRITRRTRLSDGSIREEVSEAPVQ